MTVNNSPETTANNESQNSGQSDNATVSQSEVREAVSQTAAASQIDPDNMTPKQLVELINALPDRIVDAIKEATPTKAPASTQPEEKTVENSKSGLFGGKSFGEWWVGK